MLWFTSYGEIFIEIWYISQMENKQESLCRNQMVLHTFIPVLQININIDKKNTYFWHTASDKEFENLSLSTRITLVMNQVICFICVIGKNFVYYVIKLPWWMVLKSNKEKNVTCYYCA